MILRLAIQCCPGSGRPKRYEDGGEGYSPENVEDFYRPIFFEAVDLVIGGIRARFDQPGYKLYSKLEEVLVKAASKENFDAELKFVIEFYKEDFDLGLLSMQLGVMSCNLPSDSSPHNIASVLEYLREISDSQRALISEVYKLVLLVLVMPDTNAMSERSFSSLRCIKSYLRSTMTQTRLNIVMVLYVHKNRTDELCLTTIGNEFIRDPVTKKLCLGNSCQVIEIMFLYAFSCNIINKNNFFPGAERVL